MIVQYDVLCLQVLQINRIYHHLGSAAEQAPQTQLMRFLALDLAVHRSHALCQMAAELARFLVQSWLPS